ncbi:MAG: CsbD family protein [Vicinamibacterales bacterium]
MNTDTFAGQWKQMKGDIKTKWGKLTDDDLMKAEGSYDKVLGSIQERYGYARDRAEQELTEWLESRSAARV